MLTFQVWSGGGNHRLGKSCNCATFEVFQTAIGQVNKVGQKFEQLPKPFEGLIKWIRKSVRLHFEPTLAEFYVNFMFQLEFPALFRLWP